MEGRRPRLSQRRGAPVNTFSLVSLQMNTAIEATYNINVLWRLPRTRPLRPCGDAGRLTLPPLTAPRARHRALFHPLAGPIQNGHINLIISSAIRLADEERDASPGTDAGYPYQGGCQAAGSQAVFLALLSYAMLGSAQRAPMDIGPLVRIPLPVCQEARSSGAVVTWWFPISFRVRSR